MRKHGHNIISKTTPALTRPTPATRSQAATRSDPHRIAARNIVHNSVKRLLHIRLHGL